MKQLLAVATALTIALTGAACADPLEDARADIVFGLGVPIRCLESVGCPQEHARRPRRARHL